MIIECTNCHSKYQYDEDRFERKPSKKIKCAKCQTVFEIHNPAFAPKSASTVGDSTSPKLDQTRTNKPKPQETTEQSPIPKSDTDRAQIALSMPAGKRLSLAIIDGPDAGSVYRIEKPRVTIGRSGADLTLNDSEASRQHAAVEVRETLYQVTDLGSTNGTLIDGQKINGLTEIHDKGEFQVGGTTLMLIVTEDT